MPAATDRHIPHSHATFRTVVVVASLALASLGVSACGGGSSKPPPKPAITKAAYVAQVNAICAKADPELIAAQSKLAARPTPARLASLVRTVFVPSTEAQIAAIKAVPIPPAERANAAKMLALVEGDLAKLKRNPALIGADVFGDFARVAHPYGLTACAPTS
jgi:hypothetical protein